MEQAVTQRKGNGDAKIGMFLVVSSAIVWSFGGAIARFLVETDSWIIVFWRAVWAVVFLLGFLVLRDGPRGTVRVFQEMGLPGVGVALCFATASTTFILALSYTTVANIMLMQAGAPLFAALIAWLLFSEKVTAATWMAIAAVVLGVTVMVSESLSYRISPVGNLLALLISFAFALATVLTRRYSSVRMTPAACLAMVLSACIAALLTNDLSVTAPAMGLLFVFGALNLGLGLALFTSGVRLLPAAIAALISTLETVLSPIWVWLTHSEIPSSATVIGGSVVLLALVSHICWQYWEQRQVMDFV